MLQYKHVYTLSIFPVVAALLPGGTAGGAIALGGSTSGRNLSVSVY